MFDSIKPIFSILAEMAKTRFELIGTELEEERLRWVELLIIAGVSLFLWAMGLVMASLALIEWVGELHRLQTMMVLALTFIGGAAWATWRWKSKAAAKPPLLAKTLIELRLDAEALRQGARGRFHHE